MSIKFARRVAAQMLNRGESAIRINKEALEEVSKAITREDIKRLIKNGNIVALKPKHNLSMRSKELRVKRSEGRRRGMGRRKGTEKVRRPISWEKKVRSQRMLLKELKLAKKLDNKTFNKFYMLIKGNAYVSKASLLLHLKEEGVKVDDEEIKRINERIKGMYK
jgi:large subunit ribosomal protein L19e